MIWKSNSTRFQVSAENKITKNPFLQPLKNQEELSAHISVALKNIPKVGDKKITLLVERFGSLQNLAMASVEDLASLLGASLAQLVWDYFNKWVHFCAVIFYCTCKIFTNIWNVTMSILEISALMNVQNNNVFVHNKFAFIHLISTARLRWCSHHFYTRPREIKSVVFNKNKKLTT